LGEGRQPHRRNYKRLYPFGRKGRRDYFPHDVERAVDISVNGASSGGTEQIDGGIMPVNAVLLNPLHDPPPGAPRSGLFGGWPSAPHKAAHRTST
jgi:hypothetical protein